MSFLLFVSLPVSTSLDQLVTNGLFGAVPDWNFWGIALLLGVGIMLALLKVDAYASAMIMYVWLTIFANPWAGIFPSAAMTVIWWLASGLGVAIIIILAIMRMAGEAKY